MFYNCFIFMSKIVNYTEARNNLKEYMDYVVDNHDLVFITRQNGEEVVMISKRDYQSMDETAYLLSTEANRKELLESVESINRGEWKKLKSYNSVTELLAELDGEEKSK